MTFVFAALISFLIAVLVAPVAIPILHNLKFGQEIREEGPKWHQSKSGTPTMGGVIFIFAVLITGIIFLKNSLEGVMLIYLSVAFGVIGFIDDYIKVETKSWTYRNPETCYAACGICYICRTSLL